MPTETSSPAPAAPAAPAVPRTVWALGLVSFFMDVSSETIHALLPLFLTTTLGASVAVVGIIDGVGEATAALAKAPAGYLSDRLGRRKPLIVFGYGLAALTKPLFAIAGGPGMVLGARFLDRIGKGVRGAPRDALIADATPPAIRGRAYGLRQALDTAGAFTGPLLAIGLMAAFAGNMRAVFWIAGAPAAVAVLCVVFGVTDVAAAPRASAPGDALARPRVTLRDCVRLGGTFWAVALVGVLFTLARFSEAFLVLKASAEGLPATLAPLVLVAMNAVYAIGAYPAGALADRMSAGRLLLLGLGVLIAADLTLASTEGLAAGFAGIALWGGHMALTQGLLSKLVADAAPAELRGAAFGAFNLLTGAALLVSSVLAGLLWDRFGPGAAFLAGAGFAALAAGAVVAQRARSRAARG